MKVEEMMVWIVSITVLPPSLCEGGASKRSDASGGCPMSIRGIKEGFKSSVSLCKPLLPPLIPAFAGIKGGME